MIIPIRPQDLTIDRKVQSWCTLPYPKHPRGCPNYGSKRHLKGIRMDVRERVIRECPPTQHLLDVIFDFEEPLSLIYNEYPVGRDAEERRRTHKNLKTPGEWYNLRYWQGRARAQLYREVEGFLDENPGTIVDLCPEAHGLIVEYAMRAVGIKLPWGAWPPEHSIKNVAYQLALGGHPGKVRR